MVGFIKESNLDVVSKVVVTKNELSQSEKDIYLVSSDVQEIVFASWADLIPSLRRLKFMGSTLFRMEYLQYELFDKYKSRVSRKYSATNSA